MTEGQGERKRNDERAEVSDFGTTNRFPLISIAAARTKATRLLYLRIDHARIYTSIRSALVLLLAPPLLFAPLHLRSSFPLRFLVQRVIRQLRKTGKKSAAGALTTTSPPHPPAPTDAAERVFRRSIEQTSFAFFVRRRRLNGYTFLT